MRRLLVTRRVVPLDRSDEYGAGWTRLRALCALRGAHAWLFHPAGHEDRFIEFLEWQEPLELLADSDIEEAARQLEEIAAGTAEELEEAET
jgi:hypothetical protein